MMPSSHRGSLWMFWALFTVESTSFGWWLSSALGSEDVRVLVLPPSWGVGLFLREKRNKFQCSWSILKHLCLQHLCVRHSRVLGLHSRNLQTWYYVLTHQVATYPPDYFPYHQSQRHFFDSNCSQFAGSTIFVGYGLPVPTHWSRRWFSISICIVPHQTIVSEHLCLTCKEHRVASKECIVVVVVVVVEAVWQGICWMKYSACIHERFRY